MTARFDGAPITPVALFAKTRTEQPDVAQLGPTAAVTSKDVDVVPGEYVDQKPLAM